MRISDWSSDVCSSDLANDPNWVPPLKSEVAGLISPKSNPWFEHGRAVFFLAGRGGRVIGRISAQVDDLVQVHMGAGTGQWGMFEAEDAERSEEHTSELQSLMRISYAVFCLKKKKR